MALVGFPGGWGASSVISKQTHDELNTNQEFRAHGAGNIGAGILGGMPVAGSLSKSSAAMITGIVASILYLVYRASFPGAAVIGKDDSTGDFQIMRWHYGHYKGTGETDAHAVPGVIIFRYSAPLIYSNADAFENDAKNPADCRCREGPSRRPW